MRSESQIQEMIDHLNTIVHKHPCECPAGSVDRARCATQSVGMEAQRQVLLWVLSPESKAGDRLADHYRDMAAGQVRAGDRVDYHMARSFNVTAAADAPFPPIVGVQFSFAGGQDGETAGLTLPGAKALHAHLGEVIAKAQVIARGRDFERAPA
jgi:hypothetical protein